MGPLPFEPKDYSAGMLVHNLRQIFENPLRGNAD
jgi:hypothetical protein